MRVAELGIEILRQGIDDKLAAMRGILKELRLAPAQVCYIGDDLPDLPVVRAVGLGVAVADACAELRQAAHYVTTLPGGARRGPRNHRVDPQGPIPLGGFDSGVPWKGLSR